MPKQVIQLNKKDMERLNSGQAISCGPMGAFSDVVIIAADATIFSILDGPLTEKVRGVVIDQIRGS